MSKTSETAFDRDKLARWYAQRHFKSDAGVEEIHYLRSAPTREIRFLEVNRLISETTLLEPIDFGVGIGGEDAHTLYVLDVTPGQWKAIQKGKLRLPDGWTLEGEESIGRK